LPVHSITRERRVATCRISRWRSSSDARAQETRASHSTRKCTPRLFGLVRSTFPGSVIAYLSGQRHSKVKFRESKDARSPHAFSGSVEIARIPQRHRPWDSAGNFSKFLDFLSRRAVTIAFHLSIAFYISRLSWPTEARHFSAGDPPHFSICARFYRRTFVRAN